MRNKLIAVVAVSLVAMLVNPSTAADSAILTNSSGKDLCQLQQQAAQASKRSFKCYSGGRDKNSLQAAPMAPQAPLMAPQTGGQWNDNAAVIPGSIGAVHTVLLKNGKVLIIAGSGNQYSQFAAGTFTSKLWDPNTNVFIPIQTPYDMFCNGHSILADGNVLVAGGTSAYPQYDAGGSLIHDWDGSKEAYIFDVTTNKYVKTGSMTNARWYPGMVTMSDGKVVAISGLDDKAKTLGVVSHTTDTVERYDPVTKKWSNLPPLNFHNTDPSYPVPAGTANARPMPYYPGLTLLESGRIFYSGNSNGNNGIRPGVWDTNTGGYQSLNGLTLPYQRNASASVLLPPAQNQKIMIMAGGDYTLPTTDSTAIINLKNVTTPTNFSPIYTAGPNLKAKKMYVSANILPDYTVFETGGASSFRQGGVHETSIYNPTTNTFTSMNETAVDRLYHSSSILLPDGRVAVFGSQAIDGTWEQRISIYSPPYMFKTPRPIIHFAVTEYTRTGGNQGYLDIGLAPGTTLSKISLTKASASTHSTDNDARLIDIPFVRTQDQRGYALQIPTNGNLIPAGYYLLTALDSNGIPSISKWIHVS